MGARDEVICKWTSRSAPDGRLAIIAVPQRRSAAQENYSPKIISRVRVSTPECNSESWNRNIERQQNSANVYIILPFIAFWIYYELNIPSG